MMALDCHNADVMVTGHGAPATSGTNLFALNIDGKPALAVRFQIDKSVMWAG